MGREEAETYDDEAFDLQCLIGQDAPPPDTFHLAYAIHFLLGASYLVPWNAFITAIDYFEYLYPNSQIDRVFSIVYMLPAVISILILIVLGQNTRARLRVNLGLVIYIAMLILIPFMDAFVIGGRRGSHATFVITVIAAGLTGVADGGLVQGSIVGSAGELPERYMQAVMVGTAISGVLVNVLRVITKGSLPQNPSGLRISANVYFIVSTLIMVLCLVSYNTMDRLPIIQYYNRQKALSVQSIALEDGNTIDDSACEKKILVEQQQIAVVSQWSASYVHVWKKIQGLALSVAFIYVVTLSIFPGHITEDLHSNFFGSWFAILLTSCYNVGDLIGKVLPGMFMIRNENVAIGGCVARALFYPLFYLCLHGPDILKTDMTGIILSFLLGLTNGYLTTVVMIMAPKAVSLQDAEVAGFIMVLLLVIGLALGSVLEWVWVL